MVGVKPNFGLVFKSVAVGVFSPDSLRRLESQAEIGGHISASVSELYV